MIRTPPTFVALMRETYYIACLSSQEQLLYRLIEKYAHRVSPRLLDRHLELYDKGEQLFGELITTSTSFNALAESSRASPYAPLHGLIFGK